MAIPLYLADGTRLDVISANELDRLQQAGRLARLVRRRNGEIVRAYLLPRNGSEVPLSSTVWRRQRYAYLQRLGDCRVWTLRRLGLGTEQQSCFFAVIHSCVREVNNGR